MLARLLDAGLERPPALRAAVMGGAPLPDELCERAAAARVPLAQTYGLTESCSQVTLSAIGEPQTAGRALPGSTIELSPAGEILVGGATVAPGSLAEDGLLHTGDLGEIDEEDRLLVTGRAADTIVTGGENVAPAEVEEALISHPAVSEALVHGRPDAEWGEAVVATVVLSPGANVSEDELRAHCRTRLAAFKIPKAIELAAELPRTASGKLRRRPSA
jgi:O-succinylbenzoic acid--CoA ligase